MTVLDLRPAFDLADPATMMLDLGNPKPKELVAIHEAFEAHMRANPILGDLPVTTGWNVITPVIAVNLLCRNRPGANRRLDPATAFYYANQMKRDDWKATGQPILLDSNGHLLDAQHRLYGGLIAGVSFKSFVVTDIEPIPQLFAYIDNTPRPRTPASALQTAGFNGVASVIVRVIKFAEEVRNGVYNPSGADRLQRLSPAQVLALAANYPNAQKASRSAASDWSNAAEFLSGRKDIVAYVGMKIVDLHGEEVADDFFDEILNDGSDAPEQIIALRREVSRDANADRPMKRHHMAAMLIKVFNAWRRQESLGRRWMLQVNEDFPVLDQTEPQLEAAE